MDVSDDFEDEVMSSVSRCSTPLSTPASGSGYGRVRRPVTVKSKYNYLASYFAVDKLPATNITRWCYWVRLGKWYFSEESNFRITYVKTKIKIRGTEAGWIVGIQDVFENEIQ